MSDVRVDRAIDMFKILAENEYSMLWDVIEDFEVNGHKISVKRSTQLKHVIIDHAYVRIGGNVVIHAYDQEFDEPLDYVRYLLTR